MTSEMQLKRLKTILLRHSKGVELLSNRPLISNDVMKHVVNEELSPRSLGKYYFHFMSKHDFQADDRSKVKYIMDADLAYIMTRYVYISLIFFIPCY